MLNRIVHFSLKFRGVVVALACVLLGYGLYVATHAKLDVFPNFVQPQVVIQTEAPGLSPEQVEVLVTRPIETTVNGLGDMESLRSESIEGLSIITAVFKEGTDVFLARQMLAEKLGETAGELPAGVKTPRMTPLTSSTMDLLKIGLVSDKLSPMELRTLRGLDAQAAPALRAGRGQVQRLRRRSAAAADPGPAGPLAGLRPGALGRAGGGARFDRRDGRGFRRERATSASRIQTEGQALTPEVLGEVVVAHTQRPERAAQGRGARGGRRGAEIRRHASSRAGWGVLMTMSSQYGANTMEVTQALEAALDEMKPVFEKEGIKLYPRLHRPATFIETALAEHEALAGAGRHAGGGGAVPVAGSVRTACISLTAIPLSLLTAVIVLEKFGITHQHHHARRPGHRAGRGGGRLDHRRGEHLPPAAREPRRWPQPRPIFDVVLDASLEVRRAVVYATFIVALMFLPVLTLTGLQGSFFAPLALSYILAILASLLVALTVTPALAFLFFDKGVRRADGTAPPSAG